MPVSTDELEPFLERQGPIHVTDEQGAAVTCAESGTLEILDPGRPDAWTVAQAQLELLDEQSRPKGAIPGDHIIAVRAETVGYTVVVDDRVKPEPGAGVRARGASEMTE